MDLTATALLDFNPMNTEFSPVVVASKKLVPSGVHYAITLVQQETHSSYTTTDTLSGDTIKSPPSTMRKATIRVIPQEATTYEVGHTVPGHIARTIYPQPKYKGHKEAFTGGYPQAQWVPEYTPDTDLRDAQ